MPRLYVVRVAPKNDKRQLSSAVAAFFDDDPNYVRVYSYALLHKMGLDLGLAIELRNKRSVPTDIVYWEHRLTCRAPQWLSGYELFALSDDERAIFADGIIAGIKYWHGI